MPALLRPLVPDTQPVPTLPEEAAASGRLLQALGHPLRDHLIEVLTVDGASTVSHLAAAVGRSESTVRRHLRVLEASGAVERAPAEESRGAVSFRATARSIFTDEDWAKLPVPARRALFRGALDRIDGHVARALATGGFDRPDAHVSWIPLTVDEVGHAQLAALLVEVVERAMAIQAGSDARREAAAGGEKPLETEVVLLHFLRDGLGESARASSGGSRQTMYAVLDDLADELPSDTVDWRRITQHVRRLAACVDARAV